MAYCLQRNPRTGEHLRAQALGQLEINQSAPFTQKERGEEAKIHTSSLRKQHRHHGPKGRQGDKNRHGPLCLCTKEYAEEHCCEGASGLGHIVFRDDCEIRHVHQDIQHRDGYNGQRGSDGQRSNRIAGLTQSLGTSTSLRGQ